jgi:hypothetical protein
MLILSKKIFNFNQTKKEFKFKESFLILREAIYHLSSALRTTKVVFWENSGTM